MRRWVGFGKKATFPTRLRIAIFFPSLTARPALRTNAFACAPKAHNYLALVQLASIRLWLRVYEFTT